MEIQEEEEIKQTQFKDNIPLQSLARLYKIWPGKNRFYLGGKFMTGPAADQGPNTFAWILIIGLPIIYFYIMGDHMFRTQPYFLWLSLALYLLMITSFALTQFTEPGIIPRKDVQVLSQNAHPYFLEEDNRPRKFCETCKVFKRQRTSHCKVCDNCVRVYDHHCTFTNNCIGKRNYKYFTMFLITVLLMGGTSGIELTIYVDETSQNEVPQAFLLIFFVLISIIGTTIFLFFCFHLYLMISGKTTKEQIKQITLESQDTDENDWFTQSDSLFEPTQLVHL